MITAAVAQDDQSLADAAKKSHDKTTKAKTVVTDDDVHKITGPFPEMTTEGVYNSDDIVRSMCEFRMHHTPDETERAIHDWYNQYDLMFQLAFDENNDIKRRTQERQTHPPELVYDYDWKQMNEKREAELSIQMQDQRRVQVNGLLMARIQQTLQGVRIGLIRAGMNYSWMKIRFGNGNGSW